MLTQAELLVKEVHDVLGKSRMVLQGWVVRQMSIPLSAACALASQILGAPQMEMANTSITLLSELVQALVALMLCHHSLSF